MEILRSYVWFKRKQIFDIYIHKCISCPKPYYQYKSVYIQIKYSPRNSSKRSRNLKLPCRISLAAYAIHRSLLYQFYFLQLNISANSLKQFNLSKMSPLSVQVRSVRPTIIGVLSTNTTDARIVYIILHSCTRTDWSYYFCGSDIPYSK